ncbi:ATP-binding protein [Nocardia sp. NPDC058519]|uniref:ATP-binding protein n=1 Tax=Nocardia sp. NPDC058519 TaxID=3346535 RepID=UPI003655C628
MIPEDDGNGRARVQTDHPQPPLELTFPAEAAGLAPARHAMQAWLDRCAVDAEHAGDVLLAVGEACANAVEHSHRDGSAGVVRVVASVTGDDLLITVSDDGSWKHSPSAPAAHRGRGLELMRALMTEVQVHSGLSGTVVDLRTVIRPSR